MGMVEVRSDGYEGSAVDIFKQLVNTYTRDKLALIVMVYWNIWNRRNKWVWDRVIISEFGVQSTAMSMLHEWR